MVPDASMIPISILAATLLFLSSILSFSPSFLPQGNLLDFLRSRGRASISPQMQLEFAKNICAGMAFLEKSLVVHR